jgi:hypothetical protein
MPFDTNKNDVSPNNIQFTNGGQQAPSIDTNVKLFGAGSLSFPGNGGIQSGTSTAPVLGRNNFCLEWWQNFASTGTAQRKIIHWVGDLYQSNFSIESSGSDWRVVIERQYNDNDGGAFRTQTLSFAHEAGWHHIAFVRQTGVWRLYVDGIQQVSASIPIDADAFEPNTEVSFNTGRIGVGMYGGSSVATFLAPVGNIDELRLTMNAKYPNGTSFTP